MNATESALSRSLSDEQHNVRYDTDGESDVDSFFPLAPNPHPSVIQMLVETWRMSGKEWFDSKLKGLGFKDRAAIVRLCNEWWEENGQPGAIRRIV